MSFSMQNPMHRDGLADVLERILDKGIVIAGDVSVSLVGIELLTIRLRLLIATVDKAKELGINWWEADPRLSTGADRIAEENAALLRRIEELERALCPSRGGGRSAMTEGRKKTGRMAVDGIDAGLGDILGALGAALTEVIGRLDQDGAGEVRRDFEVETDRGPLRAQAGIRVRMGGVDTAGAIWRARSVAEPWRPRGRRGPSRQRSSTTARCGGWRRTCPGWRARTFRSRSGTGCSSFRPPGAAGGIPTVSRCRRGPGSKTCRSVSGTESSRSKPQPAGARRT